MHSGLFVISGIPGRERLDSNPEPRWAPRVLSDGRLVKHGSLGYELDREVLARNSA